MERSFDFSRVLKNHEQKHKNKPAQFMSVTGGMQKRLEKSLKYRKSSRLSIFDRIRNLPQCESPVAGPAVPDFKSKVEHRKQQLEKWKEEKEKRKKEEAARKKKPFIIGVPHAPLKFVPPPPPPKKPVPGTSGRVTRSQSARITKQKNTEPEIKSFAPKNASFKPSLQNIPKLNLGAPKAKPEPIKFEPVITNNMKATRSRTNLRQPEPRVVLTRHIDMKTKDKVTQVTKPNRNIQTISSSETERNSPIRKTSAKTQKSTIYKQIKNKNKTSNRTRTPKNKIPKSESSSEERLRSPKSPPNSTSDELPISLEVNTERPRSRRSRFQKSLETMSPRLCSSKSREVMSPRLSQKSHVQGGSTKSPEAMSLGLVSSETQETQSAHSLSPKSPTSPQSSLSAHNMTPKQIAEVARKISPCVTVSRGKDNARKEMKQKMADGLLDEDASDMDDIEYFRKQLASEIKRMTGMCDTWDRISQQNVLPDAVQECILGAVGQARLLMSAKLVQFASLVERCERPEPGTALVTPADLSGFWDMVFMQVENVDMRFKKLEEMRARGWEEEQQEPVKPKVVKPVVKPGAKAVKPGAKVGGGKPAGGPSRLKEMIAAARRAKKEQANQPSKALNSSADAEENKTFEAGFFSVKSPVRAPTPNTPQRNNTPLRNNTLLKAVLSSEAKKSASKNAPFAMLRASLMYKSIECEGIAPLPVTPKPQMNLPTPGRSILKQKNETGQKSAKKSIKMVLFNDSDPELNEEKPNGDNSLLFMDVEKEQETKETSKRMSKLVRQDAVEERSPVMTRSKRRSIKTPQEERTPRRTRSEKLLEKSSEGLLEDNSKALGSEKVLRRRRSDRVLQNLEINGNLMDNETPKRSSRRRKSTGIQETIA